MPDFVPHRLQLADCRREVLRLKRLLDKSADLGEAELRKVLKASPHLRTLVGRYNTDIITPDRAAWEYPLSGSFRCDFLARTFDRRGRLLNR